ncbi:MAG: XRE family transcriptional regulator [Motiliproteus sp.]
MKSVRFDNIFKVVTDSLDTATELKIRSDLMIILRDIIHENRWSNAAAAEALGLSQQAFVDLMNGELDSLSVESLSASLKQVNDA